MPNGSRSRSRSPTASRKTRRAPRQKIMDKLDFISGKLANVKALVDTHCGNTAEIAHAAAAAAAEEVRASLTGSTGAPANFAPSLAPPTTLRAKTPGKSKKALAAALAAAANTGARAGAANALPPAEEAALAAATLKAKSMGPAKWNEFLKNYQRNHPGMGRLQAMKEAGPIYRAKYGIPEPKPKTKKVAKSPNAVAVAAEVGEPVMANALPANSKKARKSKKVKKVKVAAPGENTGITPGRSSPVRPLAVNANANARANAALATALAAGTPPVASLTAPKSPEAAIVEAAADFGERVSPAAAAAALEGSPVASPGGAGAANSGNGALPLSPATYGYNNMGLNNSGLRKIRIGNRNYYLSNNDRTLATRNGNSIGEVVGRLGPGGEIEPLEA